MNQKYKKIITYPKNAKPEYFKKAKPLNVTSPNKDLFFDYRTFIFQIRTLLNLQIQL